MPNVGNGEVFWSRARPSNTAVKMRDGDRGEMRYVYIIPTVLYNKNLTDEEISKILTNIVNEYAIDNEEFHYIYQGFRRVSTTYPLESEIIAIKVVQPKRNDVPLYNNVKMELRASAVPAPTGVVNYNTYAQ